MKNIVKKTMMGMFAFMLTGCGVEKVVQEVADEVQITRKGPKELPQKNITDFSEGLRCMDDMFVTFGFGPNTYVMLLEDIKDKTKQVNAGTREMMISALSDMSRRSQALKVIAYGSDSGNLVSFLQNAEQKGAYENVPPYDIIGSISQLDKDVVRKQADIGGGLEGGIIDGTKVGGNIGKSASSSASVLGVDMSVVTTHDIAVIPGVITRNSVVMYKTGSGTGLEAGISKLGINYSISGSSSDGTAIALRALMELSAIELIGKLAKLPYWSCLGIDPEVASIKREISDWFYQLTITGAIHTETKVHLYLRGFYNGAIDEEVTPDYQQAILAYKERLGLPADTGVDLDFYRAFLNNIPTDVDPRRLAYLSKAKNGTDKKGKKPKSIAKSYEGSTPGSSSKPGGLVAKAGGATAQAGLSLSLTSSSIQGTHAPGEDIFLSVKANQSGFVKCYLESGGVFARIFPNRFSGNGFIANKGMITLPDSPAYSITADQDGEQVHCVMTTRKVDTDLPAKLRLADFDILPISSEEEIFSAHQQATNGRYAKQTYTIKVQ
jgi:hypothetical protein